MLKYQATCILSTESMPIASDEFHNIFYAKDVKFMLMEKYQLTSMGTVSVLYCLLITGIPIFAKMVLILNWGPNVQRDKGLDFPCFPLLPPVEVSSACIRTPIYYWCEGSPLQEDWCGIRKGLANGSFNILRLRQDGCHFGRRQFQMQLLEWKC